MRHLAALIVICFVSLTAHSQGTGNLPFVSSTTCSESESHCNSHSVAQQIQPYKKKDVCRDLYKTTHCMKHQSDNESDFEKCLRFAMQIQNNVTTHLMLGSLIFEDMEPMEHRFSQIPLCGLAEIRGEVDPLFILEHFKNCVIPILDEAIKDMDCESLF